MDRRQGHRQGFTMVELLVVIAIIALLAAFLLPVIAAATASARRANCSNKQRQILLGVQMYLNNFDEYFPPGYVSHTPTTSTSGGNHLENIAYWRFLVHEFCEAGFSSVMSSTNSRDTEASKAARDKIFWTDPARGYTADYFAPRIYNGYKINGDGTIDTAIVPAADKFEGHIAKTQATQTYSASQLPVLAEVDTGYKVTDPPDWKDHPEGTEVHKGLLKTGWDLVALPGGTEVLIGVGRATRDLDSSTPANNSKLYNRFDFRHNGAMNVLFLDNHVEQVAETNATRIQVIRDVWNSLTPPGDAAP